MKTIYDLHIERMIELLPEVSTERGKRGGSARTRADKEFDSLLVLLFDAGMKIEHIGMTIDYPNSKKKYQALRSRIFMKRKNPAH